MKLYLVRWPTFDISLIAAKDETDLLWKLDEIGDPSNCKYKVYTGELHLGFRLNLTFVDKTNYNLTPLKPRAEIGGVEEYAEIGPHFDFLGAEISDTHSEMRDAFMKFCFPKLWKLEKQRFEETSEPLNKVSESVSAQDENAGIKAEQIKAAAMEELATFFNGGQQWKDLNESVKRKGQHGDN